MRHVLLLCVALTALLAGPCSAMANDMADVQQLIREAQAVWGRDFAYAESRLRQAQEIAEARSGTDNATVAEVLNLRGRNAFNAGNNKVAESMFRRDLAISMRVQPESVQTARAMGDLAATLREMCQLNEAVRMVIPSIEMRRRILPPGSAWIASGLDNLSKIRELQGMEADAIAAMEEAVAVLRLAGGAAEADLARSRQRLACLQDTRRTKACWPKRCLAVPVS